MMDAGAIAIVVPVKELAQAKTRLSPLLSLEERRRLAWLLLQGVLHGVARGRAGARAVVVTSHAPAIALGERLGFTVLRERRQVSESESVDAASAALEREGVHGVLRVPLDLPLVAAAHLEGLLDAACAADRLQHAAESCTAPAPGARGRGMHGDPRPGNRAALLVPSRDGSGTNALYRAPPTLFPSRFGPGSRALHEQAARELGVSPVVLQVGALALDIDEPGDVAELVRRNTPCPALDYLTGLEIGRRLAGRAARGGRQ